MLPSHTGGTSRRAVARPVTGHGSPYGSNVFTRSRTANGSMSLIGLSTDQLMPQPESQPVLSDQKAGRGGVGVFSKMPTRLDELRFSL